MTPYGKFMAAVVGFSPGNVLLRRQQYRAADDDHATAAIARNLIAGKIANCRSVLLRGVRDSKRDDAKTLLAREAKMMLPSIDSVRRAQDTDQVRGYEGEAAARYFRSV